jgi:hypothetical protein
MTRPSSVVAGCRAALRKQQADKALTPKDRLISELDMACTIRAMPS